MSTTQSCTCGLRGHRHSRPPLAVLPPIGLSVSGDTSAAEQGDTQQRPPPGWGISVVTPVRGRVAETRALLRSVRESAGRCPVPVEMILVDDSVPAQAREHRLSCARYDARYVAGTPHVGAKRNLGVALATHELIVFLDSDCRASPGLLARYERGMREASREVAAIAGPTFVERAPGWVFRVMSRSELLNADLERPAHRARLSWATTCNLAVRKSAFWAVGGFVTRSVGRVCGEDVDLGLRMTQKGYVITCDPQAAATHSAKSTASLSTVVRRLYNYGRSEQWLTARYPEQRQLRFNPVAAIAGVGLLSALAAGRYRYAPVALPAAACGLLVRDIVRTYRATRPRSSLLDAAARTVVEWAFDLGAAAGAVQLRQPRLLFTGFRPAEHEPRNQ